MRRVADLNMSTNTKPKCPQCGRIKAVVQAGEFFHCNKCGATFDNEPDEGGDYSDRNPAARLERAERKR